MTSKSTPLPDSLARRTGTVFRPRDLLDTYRNPWVEVRRLARSGLLRRLAQGYYTVTPPTAAGRQTWRPSPEGVALGIAHADYPPSDCALSGISAARLLGAIPRAIAVGVVAVPVRRNPIQTVVGPIHFWDRDVASLDIQAIETDLSWGYCTSPEQTILDLADRPTLGGATPVTISEGIHALSSTSDWDRVLHLAEKQNRLAAYARAAWVAGELAPSAPQPKRRSHPVQSFGLRSAGDLSRSDYGVSDD